MPERRNREDSNPNIQFEQKRLSADERRMGDRRDSHRLPIQVEVREGNGPFEGHEGNISIGGMFFRKPLTLPIGAVVQLRFKLPELEKEIQVKGEVVEITGVGVKEERGTRVRFVDLDLRSELLIAKYLDEHRNE